MFSGKSVNLDFAVHEKFNSLPQPEGVCLAQYVWIGGEGNNGNDMRCKTKTLEFIPSQVEDLPIWNYDGSSTGQAPGKNSEVYLKPVALYRDPFRGGDNVLVLCETCLPDANLTPIPTNTRNAAAKIMEEAKDQKPWFGIEQEYTLFHADCHTPFGWPANGYPRPQGPFYCSAGAENSFGRRVSNAHYKACLYAGIKVSGTNGEVMPGQWEYQVGPCEGISSGDQLTMSRYIMQRVCEDFGVVVSFDPKPMAGDWNGAGCHTNFSTEAMRNDGGYEVIIAACEALGKKHQEHISVYGVGNERRLTGAHETAPIDKFSYGVANRGCSIRIPRVSKLEGKGYLEDRRPASNMDPYVVTGKLVKTCCL
jgi:glutamine synthetase